MYRLSGSALICLFYTPNISYVCSSNWQPQQCGQSSGISSCFSAPIVSSCCCICSSGTFTASSFSSLSCFSSSCNCQRQCNGSLTGAQIFKEHMNMSHIFSQSLRRTQATCIQQIWLTPAKNKPVWGWQCCTTCIHLHRNSNILFELESQKRKWKIRKKKTLKKKLHCFAVAIRGPNSSRSPFNPCPPWEHALGQPPVINRFTSGCLKDTAWVIYRQIHGISWHDIYDGIQTYCGWSSCSLLQLPSWGITIFEHNNQYQGSSWNQLGEFSATGIHINHDSGLQAERLSSHLFILYSKDLLCLQ